MKLPFLCLTILLCSEYIQCYKWLYLFPLASESHMYLLDALITDFAREDHQVTVVSTLSYWQRIKNVKEIIVEQPMDFRSPEIQKYMFNVIGLHPLVVMFSFPAFTRPICKSFLQNPDVNKLLEQGKQFDVVFVSGFVNECALGVAPLLGKQVIHHSGGSLLPWNGIFVPQPPSYAPHILPLYTSQMDLLQRLYDGATSVSTNFLYDYYVLRAFQAEIAKRIPQNPSIVDGMFRIPILSMLICKNADYSATCFTWSVCIP